MAINNINNNANAAAIKAQTELLKKPKANSFEMDDFMQMMVAQLQNQDMNSPMDSSEYVNQMAQYSMIQAITDMTTSMKDMMSMSTTNYGVSLIGKEVTLAVSGGEGEIESLTGLVEGVNFYKGETQLMVDGKSYALTQVMSVNQASD